MAVCKYRKLLVHGVNAALADDVLLTDPHATAGYGFTHVAGLPTVVLWSTVSHRVRRISVSWDYHHERNPFAELQGVYQKQLQCPCHWHVGPSTVSSLGIW